MCVFCSENVWTVGNSIMVDDGFNDNYEEILKYFSIVVKISDNKFAFF